MDIFYMVFLASQLFFLAIHIYRSNDNIGTTVHSLNPPLSTLPAVRNKSEKHVSLGSVIGWNNNIHKERERREQGDVSNRQDNGLSKAYIRLQENERKKEKSMIDECTSRNLGDKIWHKCDNIYWMTDR
jgi:hypothetical protein